MMDRKLKRWELALMAGLLLALLAGNWLSREQRELADSLIRLHVVANSDSQEDQALKLAVRDRVLELAEDLYPAQATREEAQAILEEHLGELEDAGREVVAAWGREDEVSAQITRCWFPTKEYEDFALPAGTYTALRLTIGEGAGQNWWCVAFPPLCLGAASETVEEAAQAGQFSPEQKALITEENGGYQLKFKSMELLGELQGFFS